MKYPHSPQPTQPLEPLQSQTFQPLQAPQTFSTLPNVSTAWSALQNLKAIQLLQKNQPLPFKQKSTENSPSSNSETLAADKARKAAEQAKCRACRGLSECQYQSIGNQGFEPIWNSWSPRYEVVKECVYKRAEEARLRTKRLFGASGIPQEFEHLRLKDLEKTAATSSLLDILLGETNQLYLIGRSNSGKTRHVSALGNEFIAQGTDVLYLTVNELVTQLRYQNEEYYARLKEITEVPALIIEDFGTERTWEYNQEQLELILDRRLRQNSKLIITSEYEVMELEGKYRGARIINRLNRMQRAII